MYCVGESELWQDLHTIAAGDGVAICSDDLCYKSVVFAFGEGAMPDVGDGKGVDHIGNAGRKTAVCGKNRDHFHREEVGEV